MITNSSNQNKITAYNNTTTLTKAQKNIAASPPINTASEITTSKFDTIELGNSSADAFGTYKIDRQKLNQIKLDFAKNTDSFKAMVQAMLEKQGMKYERVMTAFENGEDPQILIDGETRAKAKEAISESGYWGANKTSERLLDFAKAISGGDPLKIETLRNAFKEGFENAKEAFGGTLPEISQMTYDKVMAGFDAWQNGEVIEV